VVVDLNTGRATATPLLPLVHAATRLIGREREVELARQLLVQQDVRLLTITGPGGVGKTRLAVELAERCRDEFADGAVGVELAAVAEPELVASTIAGAIGLHETGGLAPAEQLRLRLVDDELLLLLDNFEHVIEAASLLGPLLAACPGLTMLVTSRERLRLAAEHELRLEPLADPHAVVLFEERTRAVDPAFQRTEASRAAVSEICSRLDGLPLAIELAAARLKLFSLESLLERLDRRFDLLTGGARDLPARQQTLHDAISWSYELLDDDERRLLRALAVFVGGCTVDAATKVCGASLPALGSLVDKSLLQRSGERLSMLETIREFGLERLAEQGEVEAIGFAHADWCLELAETGDRRLLSAERDEWFERLESEYANLSVALRFLLDRRAGEQALRLAGALARFWAHDGHRTEGRRALDEALALAPSEPSPVRAKALLGAGDLAWRASDLGVAAMTLGEALRMARDMGAKRETAMILSVLAHVSEVGGDRATVRAMAEEAVAVAREAEDPWLAARHLHELGRFAYLAGDAEEAERRLTEGLEAFRRLGDTGRVAQALVSLGFAALRRGDREAAIPLLEEGLKTLPQRGTPDAVLALAATGELRLARGELATARPVYRQLLELSRQLGNRRLLADWLTDLAYVLAVEGRGERASRLLGAAQEAIVAIGVAPESKWNPRLDEALDRVRTQLGDERAAAALEAGRRLTLEQAVDEALRADAASGEDELTGREREILGLAAEGL
jgi:predicted ATPase